MKIIFLARKAAVLLLVTTLFACKKENLQLSAESETLSGPAPPAICIYPNVTVSDYAGNGGTGSENGKLMVAGLRMPVAIAQSTSGAVQYVSTSNTIRKISGIYVTDLVTLPEGIKSLAVDRSGNIYAGGETTVSKISPTTGAVLATWGRLGEPGSNNSPIVRFHGVVGLAVDPAGNIYVGEFGNRLIRKIATDGTVSDFAGRRGALSYTEPVPDGPALEAQFSFLGGIALNAAGTRLYVADQFSIRLIEGGIVYTIAGGSVPASHRYLLDGDGTSARFNDLRGIAIDGAENLYVTDRFFDWPAVSLSIFLVRKVIKMPTGLIAWKVKTIAGSTNGHVNGVGADAQFDGPHGLIINSTATTALVADRDNNRVRKLTFACSPVF